MYVLRIDGLGYFVKFEYYVELGNGVKFSKRAGTFFLHEDDARKAMEGICTALPHSTIYLIPINTTGLGNEI